MIQNNHWYNLNEQRNYPLDDTASCVANEGTRIPSNIVTDLRLRWPEQYGKYAFILGMSVTPYIVSLLIGVTDELSNPAAEKTLIAGLSLSRSNFTEGRTYTLATYQDGVGGFICFGSLTEFVGRFDTPSQSLLAHKAACYYSAAPVHSVKLEGSKQTLKGLINLTAKSPISLKKESRTIEGVTYDNVIVVGLKEETLQITTDNASTSVFSRFAGPCGKRVGSRSCDDPQPIETINGVGPDCDGVLTLNIIGCALVGKMLDGHGVVIDCALGLSDTCIPPYLPDLETGILPSETPTVIIEPPLPPEPPIIEDVSLSESVELLMSLPYCDTFDDGIAHGFSLLGTSSFGFIGDDSPLEIDCCINPEAATHYGCDTSYSESLGGEIDGFLQVASSYGPISTAAQTNTNISLFINDAQSLYRTYTTDLKIVEGLTGSLHNAGILVNYRLNSAETPNYIVALVDIDAKKFGVYYFNGLTLVALSEVAIAELQVGDWYRVKLTCAPNMVTKNSINFTAELIGVTDPLISVTINTSLSANNWEEDAANAGFYSKRSKAYFSFWRIDEAI